MRLQLMGIFFLDVGKGSSKLSLCIIENIGIAIDAIINEKVPAGIYNLSDPKEYTYDELLRWQQGNWVFPIPVFSLQLLSYVGKFMNSTFFKENTVAVVGGGNAAVEEAICLTKFATIGKLLHRRDKSRAEKMLQKKL